MRVVESEKKMIKHYREHAANERTYLAWIRTGVTIMMLGFFVERLDIFLYTLSGTLGETGVSHKAGYTGLTLAALGLAVMVWATVRFFVTKHKIDLEQTYAYRGTAFNLTLTLVMLSFGLYLLYALTRLF